MSDSAFEALDSTVKQCDEEVRLRVQRYPNTLWQLYKGLSSTRRDIKVYIEHRLKIDVRLTSEDDSAASSWKS